MEEAITQFTGKYAFLSNFYPVEVEFEGHSYKTVEHAYQAAKTQDADERIDIRLAETAAKAKRIGQTVRVRSNWENVKVDVMELLLRRKFEKPGLKRELLATGDAYLEEGNWWGDTFWGTCDGQGENKLGLLLMLIRSDLRNER